MLEVNPPRRSRDDPVERIRWLERELERSQAKLERMRVDARRREHQQWRGKDRDPEIQRETAGACESEACPEPAISAVYLDGIRRWGRHGHRWCLEHLLEWASHRGVAMVAWSGATCRDCGEPIIWAKTEATGRAMPVNRDQVLGGNLVLASEGMRTIARVLKPDPALRGYVSHFATCPNAKSRRKPSKRAAKSEAAVREAAEEIIERRQGLLRDLADE